MKDEIYVKLAPAPVGLEITDDKPPAPDLALDYGDLNDMADPLTVISATGKLDDWERTGNPVNAIEEIILRVGMGIYPSRPVMEWLAEGLEEWHDQQGHRTLEQCLGLKKAVGRTANQMKEANREHVIGSLMTQFNVLRYGFGLEVSLCAKILAAWMTDPDWYTGRHDFKPLAEETLLDYWKKAKHYREPYSIEETHRIYAAKDRRQKFIDLYPKWCWDSIPELEEFR